MVLATIYMSSPTKNLWLISSVNLPIESTKVADYATRISGSETAKSELNPNTDRKIMISFELFKRNFRKNEQTNLHVAHTPGGKQVAPAEPKTDEEIRALYDQTAEDEKTGVVRSLPTISAPDSVLTLSDIEPTK